MASVRIKSTDMDYLLNWYNPIIERIVGSYSDAGVPSEDLMQEAYLYFIELYNNTDFNKHPARYIGQRLLKNLPKHLESYIKSQYNAEVPLHLAHCVAVDMINSILDEVYVDECIDTLRMSRGDSERQIRDVSLYIKEDYSMRDISDLYGITVNAATARCAKAIHIMRTPMFARKMMY